MSDIFILLGLVIFGAIVFGMLGIMVCIPLFHLDLATLQTTMLDVSNPLNTPFLKVVNLFATFGAWVASAFVLIKIRQYNAAITWQLKLPKQRVLLWTLPVICVALLFISSFLMQVNAAIPFPESVMKMNSEENQELLRNMLRMDNGGQFIANLFIIGLAPALFEEIFFRGTLQRLLIHLFGNAHAGVWITSCLFAAVHMNVTQIVPMLFLALVLGYVCYYTKSIWPSVILHLLNNVSAVSMNYLESKWDLAAQMASDTYNPPVIITIFSFLLVGGFFYWIIQYNKKEEALNNE